MTPKNKKIKKYVGSPAVEHSAFFYLQQIRNKIKKKISSLYVGTRVLVTSTDSPFKKGGEKIEHIQIDLQNIGLKHVCEQLSDILGV